MQLQSAMIITPLLHYLYLFLYNDTQYVFDVLILILIPHFSTFSLSITIVISDSEMRLSGSGRRSGDRGISLFSCDSLGECIIYNDPTEKIGFDMNEQAFLRFPGKKDNISTVT